MAYDMYGNWTLDMPDMSWLYAQAGTPQAQNGVTKKVASAVPAGLAASEPAYYLGGSSTGYKPVANPNWSGNTSGMYAGLSAADQSRNEYQKALAATQKGASVSGPPTVEATDAEKWASILGGLASAFNTGSPNAWGARMGEWAATSAQNTAATRYQNALNAWQYAQAKDAERQAKKASERGFLGSLLGTIGSVGGFFLGGPIGSAIGGSLGSAVGSGGTSLAGGQGMTSFLGNYAQQQQSNEIASRQMDLLDQQIAQIKAANDAAQAERDRAEAERNRQNQGQGVAQNGLGTTQYTPLFGYGGTLTPLQLY